MLYINTSSSHQQGSAEGLALAKYVLQPAAGQCGRSYRTAQAVQSQLRNQNVHISNGNYRYHIKQFGTTVTVHSFLLLLD